MMRCIGKRLYQTATISKGVWRNMIFKTPKGVILFETKWEKIGYAKQWMNTIIIKTLK